MRGTPFIKEGFHGGLNTVDSPYTLAETESRDLLNVVSTERGAIKKRTGSTLFSQGLATAFPTLAVTDSFARPEEVPLSNGGRWSLVTGANEIGAIQFEAWRAVLVAPSEAAAFWNVAEQSNPAVAVKIKKGPFASNRVFGLWACLAKTTKSGYRLEVYSGSELETFPALIQLVLWNAGVSTTLASTSTTIAPGNSIGISVRAGIVRAWLETGKGWTNILTAADSTYTKGYGGVFAGGNQTRLNNFAIGESPGPIIAPFMSLANTEISGTSYLVGGAGTKLYSVNSGAEASEIGSGFSEGKQWCILQAEKGTAKTAGPIYLVNGSDKPQYWSGAEKATKVKLWEGQGAEKEGKQYYEDASTKEHVPNGKYMVLQGNRIWMAGMADDPSAVRFCDTPSAGEGGGTSDPTAWPKNNVVRFDPEDGYPITGIATVGAYVLVFKAHKMWAIHDLNTGANRKLSDTVGCVSHRSIVETNLGTFFLTADQGIYLTEGSKLHEMSYSVKPTILAINPAQREAAAGVYFNNHYYLSFASGTSNVNNRTLDYDVTLKSWWLHDLAGNQWCIYEANTGEPFLYTTPPKAEAGIVKCFIPNLYTDSGSNYAGNGALSAWWISPWEPFAYYVFRHRIKAPFLKKRVRQVFFNGSGQIIPFVYRDFGVASAQEPAVIGNAEMSRPSFPANFSQNETVFGNENESQLFGGEVYNGVEMLFGGSRETGQARLYSLGTGFVWSVGWGNASGEPFEIDSFAYMVQFRKS